MSVVSQGREVILSMSVVSVEPTVISRAMADETVSQAAAELRAKYAGKRIVASVIACQRLSGGIYSIAALESLLEDSDDRRSDVVLVIKSLRSNARVDDETQTSADLKAAVKRLNAKYGRVVVDYEEVMQFNLKERLSLWLAADVYFNTAIREGLNMHPMEYIFARKDIDSHAGVVVVSDMSACASLLNGSLKINPFTYRQVADALDKAVSMPALEADRRRNRDLPYVSKHNSSTWTKQVLTDLKQGKESLGMTRYSAHLQRAPYALPLPSKAMASRFKKAMQPDICPEAKRVFVFDYGGTIIEEEVISRYFKQSLSAVTGRAPSQSMLKLISDLASDPHNAILIIAGMSKARLGSHFDSLRNVSIASSNGLEVSWGLNVLSRAEIESMIDHSKHAPNSAPQDDDFDFVSVSSAGDVNIDDFEDDAISSLRRSGELRESVVGGTDALPVHSVVSDGSMQVRSRGHLVPMESRIVDTTDGHDHHHYHDHESNKGNNEPCTSRDADNNIIHDCISRARWEVFEQSFRQIDWDAVAKIAIPIITKFTARTNGTCLVTAQPGLGWNYFSAEPDWGAQQALQLKVELEASLTNYDVKIASLVQGSLEIVPKQLDKVCICHI
jgi:trehalose-6-phosphatase